MAITARRPTKIQSTFKIDPTVKQHVDLLADAFGKEKSRIIEEAVADYARRHETQLRRHLDERHAALDQLRETPASTRRRYAGGPVTGRERNEE